MKEIKMLILFTTLWNDINSSQWKFNDWSYSRFSKPILNPLISVVVPFYTITSYLSDIKKQSRSCLLRSKSSVKEINKNVQIYILREQDSKIICKEVQLALNK
jgi:hypothetical protein